MRSLLLDVSLRNDLSWEVEPFAEVVETLWGEGVVVPLPGELGLQVAARGEGLASLDDLRNLLVAISSRLRREEVVRRGSWCQSRCALAG